MSTEEPENIRIWRDKDKLIKQLIPDEIKEVHNLGKKVKV